MTAAFVLVINMCIAGIFAVAFGVIAATNRMARGAAFMAAGYALGIVDVALEFLLPFQTDPTPVAVSIFVVFLLALSFCLIGISRHYRVPTPRGAMIAVWASALLLAPLVFSLPYGSPARGMIYQFSYCLMQGLAGVVILRSGRRQALDLLLMGMQFVAALLYLVKPVIGMLVGTATTPQAYMATTYAAVSQTMGAVTLVAVAMVLLLVMIRDATAEMTARSETDPLSSALNRRGFELHGESALAGGTRGVLVAADLDHFKQINDSYGHAAGDGVIAHFAALLQDAAPEGAIVGRVGGEEFAVLLPDALLSDGRLYAETVRGRFAAQQLPVLGVDRCFTASFGVAQAGRGDTLHDLLHRADAALYAAKTGGRNLVRVALGELPPLPAMGAA